MQILLILLLGLGAIWLVLRQRKRRDMEELTTRVHQVGGQVIESVRVRKGSPFPDTGRGWWAWRIKWSREGQHQTSWALTTREGIKEWRD